MKKIDKNARRQQAAAKRASDRKNASKETGKRRAREFGQFSARHTTRDAQDQALEEHETHQMMKSQRAVDRSEEACGRTPREQLASLDARGMVAAKERAKLQKKIEAGLGDVPSGYDGDKNRYQSDQRRYERF